MKQAHQSLGLTAYVVTPNAASDVALLPSPEPAQTCAVEIEVETRAAAVTAQEAAEILGRPVQITVPTMGANHLIARGGGWDWEALRDYVIGEMERRFGPSPRNFGKESGIFKGFLNRHGSVMAEQIARVAFEVHNGIWRGAPISIGRFAANSDPYFASIIASTINT